MEAKLKRRQVIDLAALSGCGDTQPSQIAVSGGSLTEKSTRSERSGLCDEQIVSLRRPPMFPNHGTG
jgi:hypothetical protein